MLSVRVSKALEDVHRKMALQEFRRKRDRIALDCVRLGKNNPLRTVSLLGLQQSGSVSSDGGFVGYDVM
jgi:hypothetical protein